MNLHLTRLIFQAVSGKPSGKTYDLHNAYHSTRVSDNRPAPWRWVPLDVRVVTPWHVKERRVPGLFAPYRPPDLLPGQERGRGRGRGGFRGGRGRGGGAKGDKNEKK